MGEQAARIAALIVEFVRLQLSAAVFGLALLALILLTSLWWPAGAALTRYDALFLAAVGLQVALITFGWERLKEAKVILVFHVVGTAMEVFKTNPEIGSWVYPEENFFRIGGVPLFTGFMYAAVGSYIARAWRLFDLTFERHPPFWATALLATAIYANFITHHYIADLRYPLFALLLALYWRTTVGAALRDERGRPRRVTAPLWPCFFFVGVLVWLAENIGSATGTWLYPNQLDGWDWVSPSKIGSWTLLMVVSLVLVSAVHRPDRRAPSGRPAADAPPR